MNFDASNVVGVPDTAAAKVSLIQQISTCKFRKDLILLKGSSNFSAEILQFADGRTF
jgi:hypothetical protein